MDVTGDVEQFCRRGGVNEQETQGKGSWVEFQVQEPFWGLLFPGTSLVPLYQYLLHLGTEFRDQLNQIL
jgi:hypothetical protein